MIIDVCFSEDQELDYRLIVGIKADGNFTISDAGSNTIPISRSDVRKVIQALEFLVAGRYDK